MSFSLSWVPTTTADCGRIACSALIAGGDQDGSALYVCRAHFRGDLIPGKAIPNHRAAYVPHDGAEHLVSHFEMLCTNNPNSFTWIPASQGSFPPEAVIGGHTNSGETLYIGRASEQNSCTPGKVHPSHGCMFLSFGGQEVRHVNYEVLCRRPCVSHCLHGSCMCY